MAAVLGASEQTVGRRYRRMHAAAVVRVVGLPNWQRLGHSDWWCACSACRTRPPRSPARWPDTSWVSLTSGGTEIVCSVKPAAGPGRRDLLLRLFGIGTQAHLWMSVTPARLADVGHALAAHREVPFAAATTGPSNLVASVLCRDDHALYRYLTERIASLDGVTALEVSPRIRTVKRAAMTVPPN